MPDPVVRELVIACLRALVRAETQAARNSLSENWHKPSWNDRIWREGDPEGFALVQRAKKAMARARREPR